jgi:hypothetical protein
VEDFLLCLHSAVEDIALDEVPEFHPDGKEDKLAEKDSKEVFLSLVHHSSVCS